MRMKISSIIFIIITVIVLSASITLRFFDLDADPPPGLSTSAGTYFDGFANAHAARSYLLFGTLQPDEWDPYIYSPTHTLLEIPWFMMFGTHTKAINSFGALFSAAALLILLVCAGKNCSFNIVITCFLLSLNYVLLQFGRLSLFENVMIFFMACSLWCIADTPFTPLKGIGMGLFCMLAFATKAISIYFLPAVAIAALFKAWQIYTQTQKSKPALMTIIWITVGWLIAFLPWLILFRIPNNTAISKIGDLWKVLAFPGSLAAALKTAANSYAILTLGMNEQLWLIAVIVSAVVIYRSLTRPSSVNPSIIMLTLWFAGGFCFLSTFSYARARYFYPIVPPAIMLAAYGLSKFKEMNFLPTSPKHRWLADPLGIIVITVILRFYIIRRISALSVLIPGNMDPVWGKMLVCFLIACLIWALCRLCLPLFGKQIPIFRPLRLTLITAVCVYYAIHNIKPTREWLNHRRYTIVEFSRSLNKYPHMIIGGTSALIAVSETTHQAIRIGAKGWYNDQDPFDQFKLTHLFITDYAGEVKRFFQVYPEYMKYAHEIDNASICGYPYRLFEMRKGYNNE